MSARRKARKRALDLLYAADLTGEDLLGLIEENRARSLEQGLAGWDYTEEILLAYLNRSQEINSCLEALLKYRSLGQMAVLDRSLLRLAATEIIEDAAPKAVVINEAINLAKSLSTPAVARLVHGVLAGVNPNE